jgi:ribosomal protein uL23
MAEEKQIKKETKPETNIASDKVKDNFDPYEVIKYPLSTEKAIRQIEFDNKLSFVVSPRATKRDIKRAVEELFKVKVTRVNVQNSFRGHKRAYVRLSASDIASDVSADLGLI